MAKKIILSNNTRNIKSQAKLLPITFLESVLEKFTSVVAERRALELLSQRARDEYDKKITHYLQQIEKEGIELKDLLKNGDYPAFKRLRKKRPTRPPKYKYLNADGKLQTWTGQGRMPKPIQIALQQNQNNSLDDFLI